jgi:hypothetical protein
MRLGSPLVVSSTRRLNIRPWRVVDLSSFRVRPAARLETFVTSGASIAASGVYEAKRGAEIALSTRVFGSDGKDLMIGCRGLSHEYGEQSVLRGGRETAAERRSHLLQTSLIAEGCKSTSTKQSSCERLRDKPDLCLPHPRVYDDDA